MKRISNRKLLIKAIKNDKKNIFKIILFFFIFSILVVGINIFINYKNPNYDYVWGKVVKIDDKIGIYVVGKDKLGDPEYYEIDPPIIGKVDEESTIPIMIKESKARYNYKGSMAFDLSKSLIMILIVLAIVFLIRMMINKEVPSLYKITVPILLFNISLFVAGFIIENEYLAFWGMLLGMFSLMGVCADSIY